MLSYHNDLRVKEKYQARFEQHRKADEVIQGRGYEEQEDGVFRGCFVGCTLNNYDHSAFEKELGWPEWLAHLADKIFEGIPADEAPQFGSDLLEAVPVGVDLEPVRHKLAIWRLESVTENCQNYESIDELKAAIQKVIDCHKSELSGAVCDWNTALAAALHAVESAAASAAWSAGASAAWSAGASAAWSAAESAARSAAESAARSAGASAARSAAWSAARSAAYQKERDKLLELIREL